MTTEPSATTSSAATPSVTTSAPLERHTRLFSAGDLWAGAAAGLIGGMAMGLLTFFVSGLYADTIDVWAPVKYIAGVIYPEAIVAQPGFDLGPVLAGTLIQFTVAALLGVVFALLYRRVLKLPFALGLPALMGGVYGLALWGLTHFLLPWLNPIMAATDKPAFLLVHLVYGVVLGVAYQALHPKLPRRNVAAGGDQG